MTEYEHQQMPGRDRFTSEAMEHPNAATDRYTDAINRHTEVMARVARRLGDLECALDR